MSAARGSDAAPLFVTVLFAFAVNRVSLNDMVPLSLLLTLLLVSPPSCRSSFISITGPLWLLPPGICCLSCMIPLFHLLRPWSASSSCRSLFLYFVSPCSPSHAPPLVNRYGQKSHCTSTVRKNIFQSACLHAAHIAMQLEIWRALQGWNKLKPDTETWLVIFRALDSAGGVHWKIYHLFLFDFNTQFYSLLSFFVSSLICLLSHASPWPYTIFQRGFDLVMGEQPSDRIFR